MAEETDGLHRHFIPGSNRAWLIGAQGYHRGSLVGDIWQGTAAALASQGVIAIYPTVGWRKTREALERHDKAVRYFLVVSSRAPEVDVGLCTEVPDRISKIESR